MIKKRRLFWLSMMSSFILAAVLLAACGPSIPAETLPAETAPEDDAVVEEANTVTDINEIFGETAVSSDNSSASSNTDAIPADSEIDANGVPVGFTENGNPYRGNPNAPVVIEEFSDFQ